MYLMLKGCVSCSEHNSADLPIDKCGFQQAIAIVRG